MKGNPKLNELVIEGYAAALQGKPRRAPDSRYSEKLAWELGWRQGNDQVRRYAVVRFYAAKMRTRNKCQA